MYGSGISFLMQKFPPHWDLRDSANGGLGI
jgi:hypothetical protein